MHPAAIVSKEEQLLISHPCSTEVSWEAYPSDVVKA
jgi:hypothetical protein